MRSIAFGIAQKIGLVEDHHVGAVELILEQLLDRVLVIEIGIGGALAATALLIVGEAAFGKRLGVDHGHHAIDGHARLDLGPVEGAHQRLRQGEARGLDDDVLGRRVAIEELLHGGDEIVRHRAADAAIGELDDIVLAAGLVAAGFEDLAVDADIAELVDDERDAPPSRIGEQMADERRLAGAEEAGDDGRRDFLRATCGSRAPWRSGRWRSRGTLPIDAPEEARSGERVGGELRGEPGGHAAFMGRRRRRADEMGKCDQHDRRDLCPGLASRRRRAQIAAPVAMMVPTHQIWRARRSAAGMPGSSGASPAAGARCTARKPHRPHKHAVARRDRGLPSRMRDAGEQGGEAGTRDDAGERRVERALDAVLRRPGLFLGSARFDSAAARCLLGVGGSCRGGVVVPAGMSRISRLRESGA